MAAETCAGCTTVYAVGVEKCPQCGSTERTEKPGGNVLPSVTVACGESGCKYEGRERRVHLRTAAPGVVELPRLACAGCGLEMPTVTPWPPVPESEEESMPKTTVHGGPSIADTEVVAVSEHRVEVDPAPVEEPREDEAGEAAAAEPSPEEPSEKPEPDTSGAAAQRRSRRRNESTAE
ncbi:hypothetical protein ACJWDR_28875 [Streptomyces tauricus]|uniref:hypothetical protein n=1 Tax=Streptomyces tauricus TaxID=68274 RepID=UPI00387F03F2